GTKLLRGIDAAYPDGNTGSPLRPRPEGRAVLAGDTGYIELIDYGRLSEIAEKRGGQIVMALRTGDFVHPSIALAHWCEGRKEDDAPDDAIRGCFALGSARTAHQDLQFLIDELVEIGLRALSPGIN